MVFCNSVSCFLHENAFLMDSKQHTRSREEVNCCMPESCNVCRAVFFCRKQLSQGTFYSQRRDNFALRQERILTQTSARRNRPTPFGIRNILGLPDTDTARKDTKKHLKKPGKTKFIFLLQNFTEQNLTVPSNYHK